MELQGPNAKRMRSEDLASGEPPPRATETTEAAIPGLAAHSKEPPPPDASGGGGDGVDRISGLPDAILGEIISLLPTKEAGRTRILASRWRHVWLTSPLVLDGTDLYTKPRAYSCSPSYKKFNAAYKALARTVSRIISAHRGPGRRFCVPPHFLQDRPATVDAWLTSSALANLQELDFWEGKDLKYWYMQPSPLAPPPASVFRFNGTLRVATFGKCELLDSSVEGIHFPYLQQLGLEDVSVSKGSLHTIISSCPVLECLLLKDIFGVGCLRFSSSSVRSIGVGADHRRDNLQFLQEVIVVDAPCLERFLYLGNPKPFTVVSAPKLETFGCLNDECYHYSRILTVTRSMKGLQVESLTSALSNVKTLAFASAFINLDMVIELMKCFPCMEKLYVKSYVAGKTNVWRRKHKDFIKTFDIHLKTVVMKHYRGIRAQVNFAMFFILNARELESMRLEVSASDCNEAFFAEQYEMLQMEDRVSRGARIHITKELCSRHVHVDHVHDLSTAEPFECGW